MYIQLGCLTNFTSIDIIFLHEASYHNSNRYSLGVCRVNADIQNKSIGSGGGR